jgi:molecular chaperone DnaK
VYDLGGGTFDVTIVEIKKGDFRALATDGDVALGGRDWDERLVDLVAQQFKDDDPRQDPVSAQELWLAAEAAKRTLTERSRAMVTFNHKGSRCRVEVTRDEFEQATVDLLERTRLTTEIVVRQAGLKLADLDRVLLVGGSTRMPMVPRMLKELTGKEAERSISPDEAVAHGAALYAASLVPAGELQQEGFSVTNVNSHSLGILGTNPETGKQFNKILIPKNTPLPHTVVKKFQTYRHGQRQVLIKVLEGESERAAMCTPIGIGTIGNLPPDLPAGWPIEVSYTYEHSGQLSLSAKLRGYDKSITMEFQRENSLADEEVEMWTQFIEDELYGD